MSKSVTWRLQVVERIIYIDHANWSRVIAVLSTGLG
jgi:hypothetical protein